MGRIRRHSDARVADRLRVLDPPLAEPIEVTEHNGPRRYVQLVWADPTTPEAIGEALVVYRSFDVADEVLQVKPVDDRPQASERATNLPDLTGRMRWSTTLRQTADIRFACYLGVAALVVVQMAWVLIRVNPTPSLTGPWDSFSGRVLFVGSFAMLAVSNLICAILVRRLTYVTQTHAEYVECTTTCRTIWVSTIALVMFVWPAYFALGPAADFFGASPLLDAFEGAFWSLVAAAGPLGLIALAGPGYRDYITATDSRKLLLNTARQLDRHFPGRLRSFWRKA